MATKNKVGPFLDAALPLLTVYPAYLKAFPPALFIIFVNSLLADCLVFLFQPLINGWKVNIPFKKSSSSGAKGGSKSDGQVRRTFKLKTFKLFSACVHTDVAITSLW